MKNIIIMVVVGLLFQQTARSQGTLYLSNLGQTSAGSEPVGSDSWLATEFLTGDSVSGYELDSIELALTAASGNPSDFTVMLYTVAGSPTVPQYPGVSLGTLDGSTDPSTAGIYTFTPTANILLSAATRYFIVLTAGTSVANGAYGWSYDSSSTYTGSWNAAGGGFEQSATGVSSISSWSAIDYISGPQYAIMATAVPEPGELALVAAGGLFLIWRRRKISSRVFKRRWGARPFQGVV